MGWYSSWSTRGLNKGIHRNRILGAVADQLKQNRDTVVFLSFGSVDIEWNLAFKRDVRGENPDTSLFIAEMAEALTDIMKQIQDLQTPESPSVRVVLCFPFAPLPLEEDYMLRYSRKTPAAGPGYFQSCVL